MYSACIFTVNMNCNKLNTKLLSVNQCVGIPAASSFTQLADIPPPQKKTPVHEQLPRNLFQEIQLPENQCPYKLPGNQLLLSDYV